MRNLTDADDSGSVRGYLFEDTQQRVAAGNYEVVMPLADIKSSTPPVPGASRIKPRPTARHDRPAYPMGDMTTRRLPVAA